jgi:hypothetical protein
MLPGLGFGMKYQLMMIGTQGYLYVLVQLDFEFLRVYVVEFHQGPVVGLVVAIREHTLVFHLHFHTVKLHLVAGANIYCYIFGMMNLFKLFLKPIDVSALDDMRLHDIMKLTGRLQDGNKIIVLVKDKGHRANQLRQLIADRLKLLIGWSGQADASALTIDSSHADSITVFDEEFNKMVREYATEHKLYNEVSSWRMGSYDGIDETLAYSYHFKPECEKDTLADMAKVITKGIVNAHRSFDNLQRIARKFEWAIPVVEYIRTYPSGNDDWGAPVWHIENLSITPENLNGFMDEAKNILQDEEAIAEWRKEIISSFRNASSWHNAKVDFNIPSIIISTPEDWKKTYYEKIKPEAERRERCKDVIEEIKGQMTRDDVLRSIDIAELVDKCRLLAIEHASTAGPLGPYRNLLQGE